MRVRWRDLARDGLVAGFIAYLAVVIVVAALDLYHGHSPFYTAHALGSFLFYGSAPQAGAIAAGPVFAFNGVHLFGSILVGFLAATMVAESGLHPSFWYVGLLVLVSAAMYGIVVVGVAGAELGRVMGWDTAVAGTVAWLLAMTAYFWLAHPGLIERIDRFNESV